MSLALLPTNSLWFESFAEGCLKLKGRDVRQDWALPLPVLHAILEILEIEWLRADCWADRHRVACAGAFSVVAFCGSFRGNEVILTDLYGLSKYLTEKGQEGIILHQWPLKRTQGSRSGHG
jgi:hypothetical protein